jgi:hypothetical protein
MCVDVGRSLWREDWSVICESHSYSSKSVVSIQIQYKIQNPARAGCSIVAFLSAQLLWRHNLTSLQFLKCRPSIRAWVPFSVSRWSAFEDGDAGRRYSYLLVCTSAHIIRLRVFWTWQQKFNCRRLYISIISICNWRHACPLTSESVFMVYLMLLCSKVVSIDKMINGNEVEGSACGLVWGIIP